LSSFLRNNIINFNNSYLDFHVTTKRAIPETYSKYNVAILLFKTFNNKLPKNKWSHLNSQNFTESRQTNLLCSKSNKSKVGLNVQANKFNCLDGTIPQTCLIEIHNSFEIKRKSKSLTVNWFLWLFNKWLFTMKIVKWELSMCYPGREVKFNCNNFTLKYTMYQSKPNSYSLIYYYFFSEIFNFFHHSFFNIYIVRIKSFHLTLSSYGWSC
jgi:hypothetical protein